MSKAKHTAGPWELNNSDGTIRSKQFQSSDQMGDYLGCVICDMAAGLGTPWGHPARAHALPETLANANLIAAAPELLEACEEAQKELLGVSSYLETCEPEIIVQNLDSLVASLQAKLAIVEFAIRKAKGE